MSPNKDAGRMSIYAGGAEPVIAYPGVSLLGVINQCLMVKIVDWIYPEELFMSLVIRHVVLTAVATAAVTLTFTPAAHAASPSPQYTCNGGGFVLGDVAGSRCSANDSGTAKQIHFPTDGSTYNCAVVKRLSPSADMSFAVVGSDCTEG
jgi:hypothetical protein